MGTQPSWGPDPYRRHRLRYWDGESWTRHVMDDGEPGDDPVPAPQVHDVPVGHLWQPGLEEPSSLGGGGEDGPSGPGRRPRTPAGRGRRVAPRGRARS